MQDKNQVNWSKGEALLRSAEVFEELGDARTSFKCLLAGAGLGHTGCQLNVGNLYASGIGTRKNLSSAASWYKKAFRNGSATGAFNLAIDRQKQRDQRGAMVWLKRAAQSDHGGAHVALAMIYSKRKGGKSKARNLLERALKLDPEGISENERVTAVTLLSTL